MVFPFNRRTKKVVTYVEGSDTFERIHKYLYDGWNIVSEEIKTVCTSDDPDTVTEWKLNRYIDHGMDNHVMMETVDCDDDNGNCDPDETTVSKIWFHKDERGNVIAISDGDGIIYERYRYNVYGEHEVLNSNFTTKSTPAISPFLWGGSLYEPETDLYWMRNRYYHKDMHRFINQDPIGIWGDANNLGNGFAYVAGMVIEASDPTGLVKDTAGFDVRDSKILKFGSTGSIKSEIEDLLDIIDIAFMEVLGSEYEAVATAIQEDRLGKHKDGDAIDLSSHPWKNTKSGIVRDYGRIDKATWAKILNLINKMIAEKYPNRSYSVVHEDYFDFGSGTQRKNSDGYTDYDRSG
ncbi:MAG TPA: RHS repeat-associated core domain-containing protein, partial [bacterium]|nr:RHS repeat-associated core domain-containing protein [bacterium]